MKKVIITGGSGFIGSKITKILKLNHKIQNISFSEGSDLRKDFSLKKKLPHGDNIHTHVHTLHTRTQYTVYINIC